MLQVTEQAGHELKRMLDGAQKEPDQALRLISDDTGNFNLSLDAEREGDQVVEHEDTKVLVIEQVIAEQLEGATMAAEETPQGTKLILQRPGQ